MAKPYITGPKGYIISFPEGEDIPVRLRTVILGGKSYTMGRYFGTDGFRGEANVNLTADQAFSVGRFLGWYYGELKRRAGKEEPAKIVIGQGHQALQLYV